MGPEESRQRTAFARAAAPADLDEYVRQCVAEAPPLTAAQREAVAAIARSAPEQEPGQARIA